MRVLMRSHFWLYLGAAILIIVALASAARVIKGPQTVYVTEAVSFGNVQEIVSVSGLIEADNTADLSLPVTGIVNNIAVTEGEVVEAGQLLMTLESSSLYAERTDALAALKIAKADRDELIAGPRSEARDVTTLTVATARENLTRVITEQQEKVDNARRALYSSGIEAFPLNRSITSNAPTITGTYKCEEAGKYDLEMYASSAQSGYSYKLSGLGNGVYGAYTTTPAPLGDCGLSIQFPAGGKFGSTDWYILVPNINASSYAANYNAYLLAQEQQKNMVAQAKEALEAALAEETLVNAAPRTEALNRADAKVLQAQARLASIDASISDRTIRAPYDGTVSEIVAKTGETLLGGSVALSLLSEEIFVVTARIPEIDIAKITTGQTAHVVFDAAIDEVLDAEVTFISPTATEIDGVAYFEARLQLILPPTWLRSGLNADIEIIIKEATDVLRLPVRYVTEQDGKHYVLIEENGNVIEQGVTTGLTGNDGWIEVSGLEAEQTVIAP